MFLPSVSTVRSISPMLVSSGGVLPVSTNLAQKGGEVKPGSKYLIINSWQVPVLLYVLTFKAEASTGTNARG